MKKLFFLVLFMLLAASFIKAEENPTPVKSEEMNSPKAEPKKVKEIKMETAIHARMLAVGKSLLPSSEKSRLVELDPKSGHEDVWQELENSVESDSGL